MAAWVIPLIAVGVGVLQGISGQTAAAAAAQSQAEWQIYAAKVSHSNSVGNIASQIAITQANVTTELAFAEISTKHGIDVMLYNESVLAATTEYNNQILEVDLTNLWDRMDLDLHSLEAVRARERGAMYASMAASGTVIDEGSNAMLALDQKTQENLDAFIIQHGADVQAAKIQNAMAKNTWEGETQIQQIIWEGETSAVMNMANAHMKAVTDVSTQAISTDAQLNTARLNLIAGVSGAEQTVAQGNIVAGNRLTQGVMSGVSYGVQSYYSGNSGTTAGTSLISPVSTPAPATSGQK